MPTYVYKDTVNGARFDFFQKITDEPLEVHPDTGHPVVKVFTPIPAHFKGAGFYSTTK
ncbi:FmdB family zinc ribbon protein [Arthrobacter sp. 31Y]|uniref:FmdB family zinc ribbon protein n=1 Tax=Arthrobacter sp. 31Y TaxID=1115632 RepID=UPI0004AF4E78|nr:FmdB family transcriptional regulator [Arthrobacter sp. 31Y]